LERVETFGDPTYIPTNEDILNLRIVTQSITHSEFKVQNTTFHFFDVSGLKSHRNQWKSYFDNVDAILFVVSLPSYDQMMVEEPDTNRMNDALVVFEQIVNDPVLSMPDIILFLNKVDLFKKKITISPINKFFPDFEGILH
jgi:guanine nucleotide-binding protein subunit alpha